MESTNYFAVHRQIMNHVHQSDHVLGLNNNPGKIDNESREKLEEIKKGAKAFESYFIQFLLKEMRKGVPKAQEGGVGLGEEMYQSMFDEAISHEISESGGIGLAKLLTEELSRASTLSDESNNITKSPKVFKAINR